MVTGGDVSPDGSLVVLRTYRSVLVFERGDDQTARGGAARRAVLRPAGGGAAGRGHRLHRRRHRLRHRERGRQPARSTASACPSRRPRRPPPTTAQDGDRRADEAERRRRDHRRRPDRSRRCCSWSLGGGALLLVAPPATRQAPGSSVRPSWRAASGTNASGANGPVVDRRQLGARAARRCRGSVSSHTTAWATSSTPRVRIGKCTSSSIGVATGPVVTTCTAMPSRSTSPASAPAKALSPAFDAE